MMSTSIAHQKLILVKKEGEIDPKFVELTADVLRTFCTK